MADRNGCFGGGATIRQCRRGDRTEGYFVCELSRSRGRIRQGSHRQTYIEHASDEEIIEEWNHVGIEARLLGHISIRRDIGWMCAPRAGPFVASLERVQHTQPKLDCGSTPSRSGDTSSHRTSTSTG